MSIHSSYIIKSRRDTHLHRLYWLMRYGMAFIWVWTAIVSWFFYPQVESMDWLRKLGLTYQTYFWFAGACVLDVLMGIGAMFFASRMLWWSQILIVTFYSIAISIGLPEFLFHPFGPIVKNISVFGCLAYLIIMEKR